MCQTSYSEEVAALHSVYCEEVVSHKMYLSQKSHYLCEKEHRHLKEIIKSVFVNDTDRGSTLIGSSFASCLLERALWIAAEQLLLLKI